MIRVVVVEGSPTVRELLVQGLDKDPGIRVVGQARDGQGAVELTARCRPEVIVMDVDLPGLDGVAATRVIMARQPTPVVIVSSRQIRPEAERSIDALRAGAVMVVAKPDSPRAADFAEDRSSLARTVRAVAGLKLVRRHERAETAVAAAPPRRQHWFGRRVRAVAVAASTGGPAALQVLLQGLPATFPAPILVVQHIARGFTDAYASWLEAHSPFHVRVGRRGEFAEKGTVYVAPDDGHLSLAPDGCLAVSSAPPIGGFRPSATFLFQSTAQALGPNLVAVVLTGMGNDGAAALPGIRQGGGYILAQDEQTSVVFGMPRQAIATGVVDQVLPLREIAPALVELAGKER